MVIESEIIYFIGYIQNKMKPIMNIGYTLLKIKF